MSLAIPKILVVDDEPLIQAITRSALRRFKYCDRPVELISAENASAAREQAEHHPDVSVILLDVVMEHETAGLEFSQWVRQSSPFPECHIVLRTGQAGQFLLPAQILKDYPVNDYREKMDLANPKALHNCLQSALITCTLQQKIKQPLTEGDTSETGWSRWARLGRESGSYVWAEPPEEELLSKWPLSPAEANALTGLCDSARRLRSPTQDKTSETETHHAPFLAFENEGALQLMASYQPAHFRRELVEIDSRREGERHLKFLAEKGWKCVPWWELTQPPVDDGDYGIWLRLSR